MYYILGKMDVESSNEKGTEYWKKQWRADTVLRNGNDFYYCRDIIEVEFEDIK
jgi:hypothetical protein